MCIIIDTVCFSKVFDPTNAEHDRFQPVFSWVMDGDGSIIYGGTKYRSEISERIKKFGRLLVDLERKRRLIKLDDSLVDAEVVRLKKLEPDEEFNDPHIVAMVVVSKCCVVCTDDTRSLPYLTNRKLYPRGTKPPNVYHTQVHAAFCCHRYMAKICLPRPLVVHGHNKRKPKAKPKASSGYLRSRR
jgi:hypothetical protein